MSNTDVSSLPATPAEASQGASPGVPTGDLVRHFPRNTYGRNKDGNVELYPGMPRYEGVAAMFTSDAGEIVILAPSFEVLNERVQKWGVADEVIRERCKHVRMERLPNVASETRGPVAPTTERGTEPRCL